MSIGDTIDQQLSKAIEDHWPKIQSVFREKVRPAALAAAKNDTALETIFILVYKQLPLPLRLLIKKEAFVNYCFLHRDRLL